MPKGKKADEVGVEEGERIGGAREEDVFKAVKSGLYATGVTGKPRRDPSRTKAQAPRSDRARRYPGDLHLHSRWTDGKSTILEMVRACKERGYQYCADHAIDSQAVRVAGGLSPGKTSISNTKDRRGSDQSPRMTVFTGCEVDILPDGSLDLPVMFSNSSMWSCRRQTDAKMDMTQSAMTKRVLKRAALSGRGHLGAILPGGRSTTGSPSSSISRRSSCRQRKRRGRRSAMLSLIAST